MSKPWGGTSKIGSWAAEAELAEAEERQAAAATAAAAAANPQTFPSLKEAVTGKSKKKKMTLSEFISTSQQLPTTTTRLTTDEMLHLPTGPKLRSPDEEYSGGSRLGGGFRDYGGGGGGRRDGGRRERDYDAPPPPPSRADEVDNWGAMKRVAPPVNVDRGYSSSNSNASSNAPSRYGALGGGSRADEVDNWSFGKRAPPVPVPGPGRSSGFGSGFRDSGGSDWRRSGGGGGEFGGLRDEPVSRPRLVLDPRSNVSVDGGNTGIDNGDGNGEVAVKVNKSNPFGAARPREEVLAEKGLDWKKLDSEIEAKKVSGGGGGSRPSSSQGSRPTSSQSNRSESIGVGGGGEVRPRVKVNPFGDAKPREVLLEQKGLDWRKIDLDLEHRRVDRPEIDEEKALKEEIENLKKDIEKESGNGASKGSGGEPTNLHDLLESKEKDLENLIRELDDKVRFGQKAVERPGSGAGRPGSSAGRPGSGAGRPGSGAGRYPGFQDRPPSQSGSYNDFRGADPMDRPRSRGTGDVWTRPGEDRRGGFQGVSDDRRGGFHGASDNRRGGFHGASDDRRGGFHGASDDRRGGFQGASDDRRGGFQGASDDRRGGFYGAGQDRRGGFQGGRGGFMGNRDFNRSMSRDRW